MDKYDSIYNRTNTLRYVRPDNLINMERNMDKRVADVLYGSLELSMYYRLYLGIYDKTARPVSRGDFSDSLGSMEQSTDLGSTSQ